MVVGGGVAGGAAGVEGFGERVQQKFLCVDWRGEQGKVMGMKRMLREGEISLRVLVFVKTRDRARALFRELVYEGVAVEGIWGGRSGKGRERAVEGFCERKIWVLIATDVVGRGLDLVGVRWVVNYDVLETKEVYVHQCGRTGRNGRSGGVVTLWTEEDVEGLRGAAGKVAKAMGAEMPKLGNGNAKKRKRRAGGRDGGGQRRAKKARFGGGEDGNKREAGVQLYSFYVYTYSTVCKDVVGKRGFGEARRPQLRKEETASPKRANARLNYTHLSGAFVRFGQSAWGSCTRGE